MKIFEALVAELKRLESIPNEQWNEEMKKNSELGILIFAAKDELEDIIYGSLQAPVYPGDVSPERVKEIVQRILPQQD